MAGLGCSAPSGVVALSAGTVRTLMQIQAPANQRVIPRKVSFGFDGTSSTAKSARVRILRQTTAGTSVSGTASRLGAGTEEPQTAVLTTFSGTEPTAGDVLWEDYVPVFQGTMVLPIDLLNGHQMPGGTRYAIDVLLASGESAVNGRATIEWEE